MFVKIHVVEHVGHHVEHHVSHHVKHAMNILWGLVLLNVFVCLCVWSVLLIWATVGISYRRAGALIGEGKGEVEGRSRKVVETNWLTTTYVDVKFLPPPGPGKKLTLPHPIGETN